MSGREARALVPAVATLALLFGGALVGAGRTSLAPLGGPPDLQAWRALLADPVFAESVAFTLRVALVATGLSAALALALGLLARRSGTLVRGLLALPVPVPHVLVATLGVLWLAPGGLADRLLGGLPVDVVRSGSGAGIVLVYVYKETPFLLLLVLAALGRAHEERREATAALGLGPLLRLRWVTWPSVRRPLVVGCLVVLAFVIGALEVPLLVGPSTPVTIAEYARQAVQRDVVAGQATAAAALLVAAAAALTLAVLTVLLVRGRARG